MILFYAILVQCDVYIAISKSIPLASKHITIKNRMLWAMYTMH